MSAESLIVIVGLGNPGEEYARTRHNVGWMVLKTLERRHGINDRKGYPVAQVMRGAIAGQPVWLVRPRTYMNLSGQAVAWVMQSRQVPPEKVLVIVDDFALPLGRLRLRPNGGAGGHNGLKSIIAETGQNGFPRLRLGIGPRPEGLDQADFVLSRFEPEEDEPLQAMLEQACDCVETWMTGGVDEAMNRFNRAPAPQEPDAEPPSSPA